MENVTLNPKEQTRLQVLNSLLDEHMTLDQAATLMGATPRHTGRILVAYREKGSRRRCSRPPVPQASQCNIGMPVEASVVRLVRRRYAGANHTHLSELLSERGRH